MGGMGADLSVGAGEEQDGADDTFSLPLAASSALSGALLALAAECAAARARGHV